LSDATLENYTGTYINTLDGNAVKVIRKDGHLNTEDGTILTPVSASVFKAPGKTCIFDMKGVFICILSWRHSKVFQSQTLPAFFE